MKTYILISMLGFSMASAILRAEESPHENPSTDAITVHRPLWELGVGGSASWREDYPGADQSSFWAIPFPWGVYRGDIFRSDKDGTRARIIRGASYEFNFSAAGGLPVSSQNNEARRGMEDLEWLGEFGPRLTLDLYMGSDRSRLKFGLPIRTAFSTEGRRVRDRGWTVAPELLYDLPEVFRSRFDMFALLTVNFNDRRYNDYFYTVNPEDETDIRSVYHSRAGYVMSDFSLGLTVPVSNLQVFVFGTVQSLHGSVNSNSPLFRKEWNSGLSVVFIWALVKSKTSVQSFK